MIVFNLSQKWDNIVLCTNLRTVDNYSWSFGHINFWAFGFFFLLVVQGRMQWRDSAGRSEAVPQARPLQDSRVLAKTRHRPPAEPLAGRRTASGRRRGERGTGPRPQHARQRQGKRRQQQQQDDERPVVVGPEQGQREPFWQGVCDRVGDKLCADIARARRDWRVLSQEAWTPSQGPTHPGYWNFIFSQISMIYSPLENQIWSQSSWTFTALPPDHLLLDSAPNIGPLISLWELDKFKNCWNKSFRASKILTLLYQQFSNLLISICDRWYSFQPIRSSEILLDTEKKN